ncbi:MAG: choice-of-anchor A family protein [Ignavibacteriaceae bacterium]
MINFNRFRWFFIIPAIILLVNSTFAIVPDSTTTANEVKYPANFFSTLSIEGTTVCRLLSTQYGNSDLRIDDPSKPGHTKALWVGLLTGTIDGVNAKFYCIDLLRDAKFYKPSQPHEYTDSDVSSSPITYIVNNFYPYKPLGGGSLSTAQKEAAAVQLAIWHFSDNVDLNTITHKNNPDLAAEIKARAIVIRDLAVANGGEEVPPVTVSIIPVSQSFVAGTPARFKVLVLDNEGNGVSGITVSLSASSGSLDNTTVLTGANGLTSEVSLTQGSSSEATITASASAVLPNGNRFVHAVSPDAYQKLVLVTPTLITRTATSSVSWYTTNGPCDVNGFTTFTQGGWGSPSNSTPGRIRDLYFNEVFPSGLVIGTGNTLTLTTASEVKDFLPAGGTSGSFSQSYVNPKKTSAGVLAGQVVALSLNVNYDAAGKIGSNSTDLGDLIIVSGPFEGKSVSQFLVIANQAIGGEETGYTFSQINDMATKINENFDDGTTNNGALTCGFILSSLGDRVWLDVNKNGIQDEGEAGIPDITVELYTCGNVLITSQVTDPSGNYLFQNLEAGSYYVKPVLVGAYAFSPKNKGDNTALDSDVDPLTRITPCVNLPYGTNDLSLDAGVYSTEVPCATDWSATMGADSTVCAHNPIQIPVVVNINLTPNPGKARVQAAWRITYPESADHSYHHTSFLIEENTSFVLSAEWPGVNSADTRVEVEYSVNILNCQGAQIHSPVTKIVYWTPAICPPPVPNEADIEVIKTVDNATPQNDEIITYSVLVKNNGPKDATDVRVYDVIPAGLQYLYASVSVGSYDETTGIWTVGNLPNGESRSMSIKAKVNVTFANEAVIDLGIAADYNLFVLDDLLQPSSDTEGKIAVGRSADLANYSVGYAYPNSNGTEDVLVVGGNLTYRSGAVYSGNVAYGISTNLPINQATINQGTLRQANVIDFEAARDYLTSLSTQLGQLSPNGSVTFEWGSLNCSGSSPLLNIIEVSGADLALANNFAINAPNGSVVVVNITGDYAKWSGGLVVSGTDKRNVLFNFPDADSVRIHNIDVTGSILAPFAHVYFVTGVQNGQMICRSLTGQGQFNYAHFIGNVPVDTTIVNVTRVINSSPLDPDETNNSSFASINIDPRENGTSGGGTGFGSGNWQLAGNFAEGQMVWTFTKDNANNLIAGTMGGKIYRSTDGGLNWTIINSTMTVTYIWSVVVNASGTIFAGTEAGIYSSADNGTTWSLTSLTGHDTRALLIDNLGSLYAGTWDSGIWKSTDNGSNWMQINAGLTALAVHALAVDSQNKIYAGTYGAGVFKSVDAGSNWVRTQSPYDYIWTIKVISDDNIFAGTYGSGVYRTTNGGDFWLQMNNGLTNSFIYSITADNEDNIFVNSWNSGVFASSDFGLTWESLGMSGYGVSSIYSNSGQTEASGATLVAGTSDGAIYINTAPLVSVKETGSDLPTTYSVSQNYPNPFNPSTRIDFTIPVKSMVNLKIYNILGQEVRTLINGELEQGKYNISFDAKGLASGVYIYQLNSNDFSVSKKMILQK